MYSVVLRALVIDTDTFSSQHILSVSTQTLSQQVSLLLGALRACSHRGACQMFGCVPSPATSCALTPLPGVNGGGHKDKVKGARQARLQNDNGVALEQAHHGKLLKCVQ